MERGIWIPMTAAATFALAACVADEGKLTLRSISSPLAQGSKPIPFRIAEANGQLALGNVALALEGYRKAFRDDPRSVEALAGIATCYDRMGRFDLSRRHYEAALAITPGDPRLYAAFAGSLDQQGKAGEALAVRREMTHRLAAVSELAVAQAASPARAVAPAVEIALAAVEPVPQPRIETPGPESPPPQSAPAAASAEPPAPAMLASVAPKPAAPSLASGPSIIARSVTIALDAPRPFAALPDPVAPPARARPASGPRLERMSLGEVALMTATAPLWRARMVEKTERSATIRFAATRPAAGSVVLLNAARHQGLAARTRAYLTARGWRRIAIGDAAAVSARTVILYSPERRVLAQRLAHQFGFALRHQASADKRLTILLGRDAARSAMLQPRAG